MVHTLKTQTEKKAILTLPMLWTRLMVIFLINPLLWKLRRQIDDRIEPILMERSFDDANFIGEIEKYGIEKV